MKRLVCLFRGHRRIRVITDIHLDEMTIYDLRGTIKGSKVYCYRCGRTLPP